MAAFEIEDRPVMPKAKGESTWHEFLQTLRALKVGQSFCVSDLPSNYRIVLSAAPLLMERHFVTRRDGKSYRVGRTH